MRLTSLITALSATLLLGGQAEKADAGVFISISVAPPVLPVYVQPPLPGPGFLWTPGYWGWDEEVGDYYWVPGAWVAAPEPGLLWTPGYWGWSNGVYVWNAGYWGPHVGFYGGVSYGFGYGGAGFAGGRWQGGVFAYNRSVMNVGGGGINVSVYSQTVVHNNVTNVSFNGGNGGIKAQPTGEELRAANERHLPPTTDQMQHQQLASKNPAQRFSANHGKPTIAATSRAGDFSKDHVVAAKSAGSPTGHNPGGNPGFRTQGVSHGSTASGTPLNRTQGKTNTGGNPPKNAALNNGQRKAPPPPRPGQRPAVKQPPKEFKKPG